MAALIFVATWLVHIPIPRTTGYLNLGDVFIVSAAFLVGGPLAAAAAAIGSGLADVASGAAVYLPATVVIKAVMALAAGLICQRQAGFARLLTAAVVAELIMVGGYFAFEWMVFDLSYALAALPFNALQLLGNLVAVAVFAPALKRVPLE
jgi:uncharacterized membrane protein